MTQSRRFHLTSLLAACGMAGMGSAAQAADSPLIGTWSGRLMVGGNGLRLRLIISDAKTAKVISLDQGNSEIVADTVMLDGNILRLGFVPIKAEFVGTLKDADHIDGTFTQMGNALPLNLTRGEAIAELVVAPLTQARLQALRIEARAPALAAAWRKADAPAAILCDGLRASNGKAPVTPADQWHWGSITKSMTATLVARLVEAKVVNWNTTVGSVLGAKVPDMQAAYKDVTFLHLLSHRAGLQANIPSESLFGYARAGVKDTRAERLKYAAEALTQTPAAPLAAQMIYSNNGFIVAGAMLEAVTGKSWETLIQTHLFAPLKLVSAGFGPPDTATQPMGHMASEYGPIPVPGIADNPVALGPAGRVHMNLNDMMAYLSAHRDRPASLLTQASWDRLHTPPFGGDYALGWVVRPDGSLWHNGSNTFWYGEIACDAKTGVVSAAVANNASQNTMQAIAQTLAATRAAALA